MAEIKMMSGRLATPEPQWETLVINPMTGQASLDSVETAIQQIWHDSGAPGTVHLPRRKNRVDVGYIGRTVERWVTNADTYGGQSVQIGVRKTDHVLEDRVALDLLSWPSIQLGDVVTLNTVGPGPIEDQSYTVVALHHNATKTTRNVAFFERNIRSFIGLDLAINPDPPNQDFVDPSFIEEVDLSELTPPNE
jgi:hypothetical protein